MDLKKNLSYFLTPEKIVLLSSLLVLAMVINHFTNSLFLGIAFFMVVLLLMAYAVSDEERAQRSFSDLLADLWGDTKKASKTGFDFTKEKAQVAKEKAQEARQEFKKDQESWDAKEASLAENENNQVQPGPPAHQGPALSQDQVINSQAGGQENQGQADPQVVQAQATVQANPAQQGPQAAPQQASYRVEPEPFELKKHGTWLNYLILLVGPIFLFIVLSAVSALLEIDFGIAATGIGFIIILYLISTLYYLPTLISYSLWKYVIFILNIFFSWTIIGWIVLLILAIVTNSSEKKDQYNDHQNKLLFGYVKDK